MQLPTFVRNRLKRSFNTGVLSPAGALWDLSRPRTRAFLREPFNGQSGRRTIVDDVLARVGCEVIVETGTFRGATTDYFTRTHRGPVVSIEATNRYLLAARLRLRGRSNLRLVHSDSRTALRELARDPALTDRATLFYLDAHWFDDLPLADEVRIIAASWRAWVAVVDDFAVPDDPGYTFDAYAPDRTLDRAYLARAGVAGLRYFWPRRRSADEDGMVRGCVVITSVPDVASKLAASPALRSIE